MYIYILHSNSACNPLLNQRQIFLFLWISTQSDFKCKTIIFCYNISFFINLRYSCKEFEDLFTRYSKEIEVQRVNVGRTRVSIGNFCSMRFLPYRPSSARVAVYITHRVYSSVYTSDSGRRVKRREKEALFGMRGERKYFQIRPFNLDGGVCARQTGALG